MGQPIRGMTRPLPVKASIIPATIPPEIVTLNADFNASIHNRFDIEVIDTRTGKVRQRAQAENVILGKLWTRLLDSIGDGYFNYIHYGTGSGTPASTDTALFNFLGYGEVSGLTTSIDVANCIYSAVQKTQLAETTAVGLTLTEVGIAYDTGSTTLCTHAMFKDMNGNAISIAKTATDIINIYATVFVHWPSSLYSGNILMTSNSGLLSWLSGTVRYYDNTGPRLASFWKGRRLYGKATNTSGISVGYRFDAAAKTVKLTMTRLAADIWNTPGGFQYINLLNDYRYDYIPGLILKTGDGWYPGSTITGEAIGTGDGTTVDFSTSFDCPKNATIYVDGTATTAVTVDEVPLTYDHMEQYMEQIQVIDGVAYPYESKNRYTSDALNGIYYNPYYQYGIKSYTLIYAHTLKYLKVSNDLINWTDLPLTNNGYNAVTIAEKYRNYKYWDVGGYEADYADAIGTTNMTADTLTGKNIHFTTAPASGAVITADYHTAVVAKDVNHVFDLTVTIQLGEYTA